MGSNPATPTTFSIVALMASRPAAMLMRIIGHTLAGPGESYSDMVLGEGRLGISPYIFQLTSVQPRDDTATSAESAEKRGQR